MHFSLPLSYGSETHLVLLYRAAGCVAHLIGCLVLRARVLAGTLVSETHFLRSGSSETIRLRIVVEENGAPSVVEAVLSRV